MTELEQLRAEVDALRRRLDDDQRDRDEVLQKLTALVAALESQQIRWTEAFTSTVEQLRRSPEVGHAREEGLLPFYAQLATRQHATEERVQEYTAMVLSRCTENEDLSRETQTLCRQVLEALREFKAARPGSPEE